MELDLPIIMKFTLFMTFLTTDQVRYRKGSINGEMNMKTFGIAVSLIVFFLIGCIASYQGLDLRKPSSWLYGAISFLCGLALGLSLNAALIESLKTGGLFAVLILAGGAAMRRHKQKYNVDTARFLLLKYGKEDDPSLFAKLVRVLLGKYKQS